MNYNATQLKNQGVAVVSGARKLIFKVPQGPVVWFPEGVTISSYGQNNLGPVIVVHNHVDVKDDPKGSWQGADAENGVVILNAVSEDAAHELLSIFDGDPTVDGLNKVLARAEELGFTDNYTTNVGFVSAKLSPAGLMIGEFTGIVKRDDRDVAYVARGEDGVIYRLLGTDIKHIDTDEILKRDYVLADGNPIDATTLPVIAPEEAAAA